MATPSRPPSVVTLSREEMKSRALAFAKSWAGPQREEADAKTFLDAFLNDRERVEYLFALYEKLSAPLAPAAKPKRESPKPAPSSSGPTLGPR